MKKLLVFSIFLLSFHGLIAQIKVGELSATPVDVLNNFYFKGGSLNGKYKLSLEKVMVNEISSVKHLDFTSDNTSKNEWNIFEYFTGIGKNLFYFTSSESFFDYDNYQRVPKFIPTLFDKSELNIYKGSNDKPSIEAIRNYLIQNNGIMPTNKMFLESTMDDIFKMSPTVEIIRDKLVEVTINGGDINYYLLNSDLVLNNIGTKTIQLYLANEKVNSDDGETINRNKHEFNENDFFWRLFNVKNEIYLILTFRDVRELNMSIPSFIDLNNHNRYEETFNDKWDTAFFGSNAFYISPKVQNIDKKIFLEPRFCLFFFKLKTVN